MLKYLLFTKTENHFTFTEQLNMSVVSCIVHDVFSYICNNVFNFESFFVSPVLCIGERPSNSLFLKKNVVEAHSVME